VTLFVPNNPGGDAVLAYITHYLLTGVTLSKLATPFDMRYRKALANFYDCQFNGPNSFCYNVTTGSQFPGSSFFTNRNNWRRFLRGHHLDLMSGLFTLFDDVNATNAQNLNILFNNALQSQGAISQAISLVNSVGSTRPFTQIQILTNGFCVSTCSVMSSLFHFVPPTSATLKFINYGGIPGSLMDTSVAAANVIEFASPQGNYIINVPFREMLIPSNTTVTRQFSRFPPDVVLPIWHSTGSRNTLAIWQLSFNLFT